MKFKSTPSGGKSNSDNRTVIESVLKRSVGFEPFN